MDKNKLRIEYKKLRNNMTSLEHAEKSAAVYKRLIETDMFNKADVVFCFAAAKGEPDTNPIIETALSMGKTVALPVVVSKTEMIFREITGMDDMEASRFGILEPKNGRIITPKGNTLVLVPGLVFSENFARIGYGGGYYDRYFGFLPRHCGLDPRRPVGQVAKRLTRPQSHTPSSNESPLEGEIAGAVRNDGVLKVSICFDFQIVEYLENDEHEIKLDSIITDKNIYMNV